MAVAPPPDAVSITPCWGRIDALDWLRVGIHGDWSAEQVKQYLGEHVDEYRRRQRQV